MKGHLRKRGKNSWAIVIDLGKDSTGKRRQKWHTVRGGQRAAQKEMHKLITQLDEGTYVSASKETVGVYLERWLSLVKPLVAIKTYSRYEEIVRLHLVPALGHHPLQKLNALHIEEYYKQARENGRIDGKGGLSERTVLHHHRVLNEALKKARRLKLRATNPCEDVDAPRPQRKEVEVLDEAQTAQLLKVAKDTRLYVPILVDVTTGLRLGELLGLRWKDIDYRQNSIYIHRTLQRVKGMGLVIKDIPKTKKSIRTLTVPAIAIDALKSHEVEQKKERLRLGQIWQDNDLVFPDHLGRYWGPDCVSAGFKNLVRKLGFDGVSFHSLRHSHASHLLRQNKHMKITSERLGHSSINITMDLYSHLMEGMQNDAAEKVNTAIKNALTKS